MQDRPARTMRDNFAAVLALNGDVAQSARRLGRPEKWGWRMFREICDELGVVVDEKVERARQAEADPL